MVVTWSSEGDGRYSRQRDSRGLRVPGGSIGFPKPPVGGEALSTPLFPKPIFGI